MKKVKEIFLEIPKAEIRCFFCYCSLKNEVVYSLDDNKYYHYDCLIEKFRVNEVEEFTVLKKDSKSEIVKVPPEKKLAY